MSENIHESRVYYNLVEANAAVPRLELLFAELGRIQQEVNSLVRRARKHGVDIDPESIGKSPPPRNSVRRQIEDRLIEYTRDYDELLDEIRSLGVVIDDIDAGSVNFYSWIDGHEVFLSWQTGEPEIAHWHAVTEDSTARRSLRHIVKSHRPAEVSLH